MASSSDQRPFDQQDSELEVNAVLLTGADTAVAVVAVDALYVGEAVVEGVNGALREDGLEVDVWLCASHTHNAPGLERRTPLLGSASEGFISEVVGGVHALLIELITSPGRDAQPFLGRAATWHSVNRRRRRPVALSNRRVVINRTLMRPSRSGSTDEGVVVLTIQVAGEPVAVIWNYACHPVSHPMPRSVSAHYPGVVRTQIREVTGRPDLPVVFLQGFSGDTRPPAVVQARLPLSRDRFAPFADAQFRAWTDGVAGRVVAALRDSRASDPTDPTLRVRASWIPLQAIYGGVETGRRLECRLLEIGDLTLVAINAEPVTAYAHWLRTRIGGTVMPVGCLGAVVGYLPVEAMLAEGGYEADGFTRWFGVTAVLPGVERTVKDLMAAVVMPDQPTDAISLLAAVRNEAQHLPEMIDSVLAQPGPVELVVVDDHSTDATRDILDSYARRHDNIRWLTNPGKGKVAAFNAAFEHSTHEYVVLLAGDDRLPPGALQAWRRGVRTCDPQTRVAAYAKLRTFSANPKFHGHTIPRGQRGNRSGATTLMSRVLAEEVFPVPPDLPSEDVWTGFLSEALASQKVEVADVVLEYRVHSGNSNPRQLPFDQMTGEIARRMEAYIRLNELKGESLTDLQRKGLRVQLELETARQAGALTRIAVQPGASVAQRLRALSMAHPILWRLRQHTFGLSSGW